MYDPPINRRICNFIRTMPSPVMLPFHLTQFMYYPVVNAIICLLCTSAKCEKIKTIKAFLLLHIYCTPLRRLPYQNLERSSFKILPQPLRKYMTAMIAHFVAASSLQGVFAALYSSWSIKLSSFVKKKHPHLYHITIYSFVVEIKSWAWRAHSILGNRRHQ